MLKLFTIAQLYAMESLSNLRKREEGQTMAEYGVVLAVITVGIIGALILLSGQIETVLKKVSAVVT
jgi:Flp pilus assembly pilin Flp